jgi:hypothetical protein
MSLPLPKRGEFNRIGSTNEKAVSPRDGIRSQLFDVLKAQRKGDRQCKSLRASPLLPGNPISFNSGGNSENILVAAIHPQYPSMAAD